MCAGGGRGARAWVRACHTAALAQLPPVSHHGGAWRCPRAGAGGARGEAGGTRACWWWVGARSKCMRLRASGGRPRRRTRAVRRAAAAVRARRPHGQRGRGGRRGGGALWCLLDCRSAAVAVRQQRWAPASPSVAQRNPLLMCATETRGGGWATRAPGCAPAALRGATCVAWERGRASRLSAPRVPARAA